MREIGLTPYHSMDTTIPVVNVVFLLRLCSMSLQRTGEKFGNSLKFCLVTTAKKLKTIIA
jgi:hypothetical protein